MSHRSTFLIATLVACTAGAAQLAAQQDTSAMQHDTTMMDHGSMDKGSMDHGSMDKGSMEKGAMGMAGDNMFMGAAGQKAGGDYQMTDEGGKSRLTLTDNFAVAPAADLYLVLANGDTPDKSALYLGKLKQPAGAQSYDLPKGKDLSGFTHLLVWSKKEKRAVASAAWHPAGGAMNHM